MAILEELLKKKSGAALEILCMILTMIYNPIDQKILTIRDILDSRAVHEIL